MVSEVIKSVVRRLFADNEFRQAFVADPDAALAGESLSAEERRALFGLRTRLTMAGNGETAGPLGFWP